ncbi:MAG: class I SAM-dependent methyltransferase [Oscillospiraceae bacterium]
MIVLSSRLKAVAGLCRRGVTVCDVGTDHAYLACYLAQNGARNVIASDVRDGPLEAARRTVEQQGVQNVTLVKSDGLEKIGFADDVVIAGMGGELIMRIIAGCRFLSEDTRFILQPMTKAEILRRELYRSGFEITEERTAREGERLYTVMLVQYTGNKREMDELFCRTGRITDPAMLRHIAGKLLKNAAGMEKSQDCQSSGTDAQELRELAGQILARADDLEHDRR